MSETTPSISALLAPALYGSRPILKSDLSLCLDLLGVCEGLISRLPSDLVVKYQLVKHHIASKLIQSTSSSLKSAPIVFVEKQTQANALPPTYLVEMLSKTRAILRGILSTSDTSSFQVYADSLSSMASSEELLQLTASEVLELCSQLQVLISNLNEKINSLQNAKKAALDNSTQLTVRISELQSIINQQSNDDSEKIKFFESKIQNLTNEIHKKTEEKEVCISELDTKWKETVKRYRVKMLNWHESQVAQVGEKYEKLLRDKNKEVKTLKALLEHPRIITRKSPEKEVKNIDQNTQDFDLETSFVTAARSTAPVDLPLLISPPRQSKTSPKRTDSDPSLSALSTPRQVKQSQERAQISRNFDLSFDSDSDSAENVRNSIKSLYSKQISKPNQSSALEATKLQLMEAVKKSKEVR
ncbi:hypothetical protein RCL1_004248 [Eukaryota sp. TZLM3-RCL]